MRDRGWEGGEAPGTWPGSQGSVRPGGGHVGFALTRGSWSREQAGWEGGRDLFPGV